MGGSPSKAGAQSGEDWGFFEACNCASDDCTSGRRMSMDSPKPYTAFSSPHATAGIRSPGSLHPHSRQQPKRSEPQHPKRDAKVVGMAVSPRFLNESPRGKSMSRLLSYNESPRVIGTVAPAQADETPGNGERRKSSIKQLLRFDDEENEASVSLSPPVAQRRGSQLYGAFSSARPNLVPSTMDYEEGYDLATGQLTVIVHAKPKKPEVKAHIKPAQILKVKPALDEKTVKEAEMFFAERQQAARQQVRGSTTNFEDLRQSQNLSNRDRDMIGIIKSKEAQVRAQTELREKVQGGFWNPHAGVAPVYSVKATRPDGFRVLDRRPEMDNLDAIEVVRSAGGNVTGLHSSNEHHHRHHKHEEAGAKLQMLRRRPSGENDDSALGMPSAPKPKPTPESVFGNAERALKEQVREQNAAFERRRLSELEARQALAGAARAGAHGPRR